MTHSQCNAHLTGSNHMANSTTTKEEFIENDKLIDKYIKTFDITDDPIVYVLIRTSPYTMNETICGVFDSRQAVLCRLNRIMDRPTNDEMFKIETHNLRDLKTEQELD